MDFVLNIHVCPVHLRRTGAVIAAVVSKSIDIAYAIDFSDATLVVRFDVLTNNKPNHYKHNSKHLYLVWIIPSELYHRLIYTLSEEVETFCIPWVAHSDWHSSEIKSGLPEQEVITSLRSPKSSSSTCHKK